MFKTMVRHAAAMLLMIALCAGLLPFAAGAETLGGYEEEDLTAEYDASTATALNLASIEENTYTISKGGVYVLTGSWAGQLIVEAGEEEVVRLVFEGASITSALGPAVYVKQAEKVVVTLAEGTENALSGGPEDEADQEGANAALYSKEDLSINGAGSLSVTAEETHGIECNDDLIVAGGAIEIQSGRDGIKGKDSVRIHSGEITIQSGEDGIVSDNDGEADKGYVVLDGGTLTVTAENDGVQAETTLQINGGDIQVVSGGGSANVTPVSNAGMQARGGFPGQEAAAEGEQEAESAKGLKAGAAIEINGGTLGIDSKDDAIHSNGSAVLRAGSFSISTGDDAVHADGDVTVEGGTFDIPTCYEGIEGSTITISGGEFDIVASDDGFNAAGGADGSGTLGFGMDEFAANPDTWVVVDGGTITVTSQGDCIDSNGALTINGGTLNLTCGGNGNTALDANGTYQNNGGSITTNDGSESGVNFTGGRMGMGGNGNMGGMPGGMRR